MKIVLMCSLKYFLSIIILLFSINCEAQSDNLKQALDELALSYTEVFGFSGNIKVVLDEKDVFEKSYGLANRSFHIKNTKETRFSINSISKTFTSTAVLLLAQEQKIDLHKPINTYLPHLLAKWKDSITVHHLLTHSSGLPRESGIQPHQELSFAKQIQLIEKQKLLFTPGEKYEYSNSGIILLGAIIENVSGMTYADFINSRIIQPLDLKNTGYYSGRNVIENLAVPYRFTSSGLEFAQRSKHYGDNAGGGLYSTLSDLYKYVKSLEENKILNKGYTDLLFQPHIQSGETDYEGYAWSIKYFGDEKIHFAAGSGYGTKSVIIRSPESGNFIGITSNWGNTPILQLLGDIYLTTKGQKVSMPTKDALAKPELYRNQLGVYLFDQNELKTHLGIDRATVKLHEFEGKLFLDDELLAEKNGHLHLSYTEELQISFAENQMIININDNTIIGEKI